MKNWIWSTYFLALVSIPAGAADVRLDSYRHPENQRMREFSQVYLDGVRAGLMAYNARARKHGGQMAFCMPGDLALTTGQTEEIMLRRADKSSAKGDALVATLLLFGLQDTYPCENADSR